MRNDESFDLFFKHVKQKAAQRQVEEPKLSHERKSPNYSIIEYVDGHKTSGSSYHPATVENKF